MCVACGSLERGDLCARCRRSLRRASIRTLPSGLRVRSAFRHQGAARTLVHRLKYQGLEAAAFVLASEMLSGLTQVEALVPVPRVSLRRLRYGVDQSARLASALSALSGLPVIAGLSAALWSPRRAGRNQVGRSAGRVQARDITATPFALVDDVLTTGETLMAVTRVLPVEPVIGVTATAAPISTPTGGLGSD